MSKHEKFIKQYQEMLAQRTATQEEIDTLNVKAARLADEAEEKAHAGDVDGYMDTRSEADRCQAEVYVKRLRLENLQVMPQDAAIEAWADYAGPASKELQKRLAAYKEARKKLYAQYVDMMEFMRSACRMRNLYIRTVGGHPGDSNDWSKYSPVFPIQLLNFVDVSADGQYFTRSQTAPGDEANRFNRMAMTGQVID